MVDSLWLSVCWEGSRCCLITWESVGYAHCLFMRLSSKFGCDGPLSFLVRNVNLHLRLIEDHCLSFLVHDGLIGWFTLRSPKFTSRFRQSLHVQAFYSTSLGLEGISWIISITEHFWNCAVFEHIHSVFFKNCFSLFLSIMLMCTFCQKEATKLILSCLLINWWLKLYLVFKIYFIYLLL